MRRFARPREMKLKGTSTVVQVRRTMIMKSAVRDKTVRSTYLNNIQAVRVMRRRDGEEASRRVGASATRSRLDRHARTRLRRRRRRETEAAVKTTNAPTAKTALASDGAGKGDDAGTKDDAGTGGDARKIEDAGTGDDAGTGNDECVHALGSGAATTNAAVSECVCYHAGNTVSISECALVANLSSRACNVREVNKQSRVNRAQFNAQRAANREACD